MMPEDWEEEITPDAPESKSRRVVRISRPIVPSLPVPRRFEQPVQDEGISRPEPDGLVNDAAREALNKITELDSQDREELFGTGNLGDANREVEDDMSDLVDVDRADILGDEPTPTKPKYRIMPRGKRVIRRYPSPPGSGFSGMRR